MLADRVRMMLGGVKGMKTYKINVFTNYSKTVKYVDYIQEDGLDFILKPLTSNPTEIELGRYVILVVNEFGILTPTVYLNNVYVNPVPYTRITDFTDNSLNVYVYDLEVISNVSGVPIEDFESINFVTYFD